MSYSDDLFNSENNPGNNWNEDDSNELSPTDGYFNSNQIPQNISPDPTLSQTEDISKAQDAKGDFPRDRDTPLALQMSLHTNASSHVTGYLRHPRTPSDSLHASPSRRGENSFPEHQPFFDQPPLAYIASAESSPVSAQGRHTSIRYNTFSQHRLEEGLPRELQSMGGPADYPEVNEETPLWLGRTPKKISFQREIITKALGLGLALIIAAVILGAILTGKSNPDSNMGGGPIFPDPIHDGGSYCQHVTKSEQTSFDIIDAAGLVVIQEFYQQDSLHYGTQVKTAGEVRIRNLPRNSNGGRAHFTVEVKLSHPELSVLKTLNELDGSLKISTPRFANPGIHDNPCISLEITAWIPEDAEIFNVFFDLVTLSIRIFDDVNVTIVKDATLKTVSGHVKFPNDSTSSMSRISLPTKNELKANFDFDSRHIVVETVSGRIEGTYPLYDLLKISSQSGTIGIEVKPKPALESAPAPATLNIHTSSGRIEVSSPVNYPKATCLREYITHVKSLSGAIEGDFFVGSTGTFDTASSRIQLVVRPVLSATSDDSDDESRNEFYTHSVSGTTHVTLLDPWFTLFSINGNVRNSAIESTPNSHDSPYTPTVIDSSRSSSFQAYKSKLRTVHSTHKTSSGSIEAYYPSTWIGNIEAKTISGRIELEGKGIGIVERHDGWGYKNIKARKGVERDEDGSSVKLETLNAAIALRIYEA
ncbi:uncharacterized protein EAF01_011766 [Botrytis porri]|uniref:Adhesin domain-containing protein n=1 Tax=Botrytis porri TaxID=87229 RepID=A0A4Z1KCL9_9HELO|nr:uncharacterized protein EAF01_011766 [Botrytis porri]KAF7882314.1 hypothetical protein EAF01_011766 [Botrytis porri]TGO83390.1 hypothetical protein BPOR_0655g00050 [Botrytis porri]